MVTKKATKRKATKVTKKAKSKITHDIMSVDLEEVKKLVKDGSDIFMTADAEKAIVELFAMKDAVEEAIEKVKENVEAAGLKYHKDFTSIKADSVRVQYRAFGGKYVIDSKLIDELNENMYKTKTSYSPVTKEIESFVDEYGNLPLGVSERERAKKISIIIKK